MEREVTNSARANARRARLELLNSRAVFDFGARGMSSHRNRPSKRPRPFKSSVRRLCASDAGYAIERDSNHRLNGVTGITERRERTSSRRSWERRVTVRGARAAVTTLA
ncbi:hypothetical protein EVAR_66441_1 [Eumeta japonica]|uniref:Uncharacterized protein n=1 Tax=Eumeta variegata TaxID=151549 RepID=A0A4C2A1C5_EUMVA|nr:hypothetical protein EVAR_66441_1 [Eumeta japonica]